jgi:hypothetical protein
MENSLIIKRENIIREFDKNGMANLVKPLNKKIYIASPFMDVIEGVDSYMKEGEELDLRIGDERFDKTPVDVFDKGGKLLGEISKVDNVVYYNLLKGGKELYAKVSVICVSESGFAIARLDVSMVDI